MNEKASQFRSKRDVKALGLQADQNHTALQQMQQLVMGLSLKTFELETKLRHAENVARLCEYRTRAIVGLMEGGQPVGEKSVIRRIMQFQEEEFEKGSALDDQQRNLEVVTSETAQSGMIAITTIRLFKDGAELEDERVVRSKIELGRNELFKGLDEAIIGLQIGESKSFPLNIQDKTDSAEVTLLGLRRAQTPEPELEATQITEKITNASEQEVDGQAVEGKEDAFDQDDAS